MKAFTLYLAIFALVLLTAPMLALGYHMEIPDSAGIPVHSPAVPANEQEAPAAQRETAPVAEAPAGTEEPAADSGSEPAMLSEYGVESLRILDETTGEVHTVPLRDFVRGAVAAEMPANFHMEALKAQAVAAHTYALRNHLTQQETPDPELKGADFSADPANLRVYMTEADAKEFYGDLADTYWPRICEAADSVLPYVLEYDDEPIVAAYHAISAGQTEDAANVWVGSAPYLAPADSAGDRGAPDFHTQVTVPSEELFDLLTTAWPDIRVEGNPADWFSEPVRSQSGYVTAIVVGDREVHGKEIRQLLDLRSHNFEVAYTDAGFVFDVYGYGHGVGLSQYGAHFLAKQGADFREILETYYTGATLKQVRVGIGE